MNEHNSHLGRLLDEASAHYQPQLDVARLERILTVRHRRRAGMVVWSAAACFALIGGTAFAFNQQTNDEFRLAPAHEGFDGPSGSDHTESTPVKTTEHHPYTTLADGGHEPVDMTTLPHNTEPPSTEPTTTVKKYEPPYTTQPHTTEPHTTEPHTTEPPSTEPPSTEPTTTVGEPHYEWSVHQLKGSTDAEPVTEVFWGTANPGDKIYIQSSYGNTFVYANGDGGWEAHITFEGAPVGTPFGVYVHAPGHDQMFTFTYYG